MTRLMLAVLLTAFSISCAAAQTREACEPKAVGSDGKALKGAAKKSFMGKCEKEQA
jgi:hypothetical protein